MKSTILDKYFVWRFVISSFLFLHTFSFEAQSQTITEYPVTTVAAVPSYITAGPQNKLWFTMANANKIGRSDLDGNITEFTIPTATSNPAGITRDGNGDLWFCERNANKIAKIPSNAVSGTDIVEYSLPSGSSEPNQIVLGKDGALWFTQTSGNRIGRITTDGTITEWTVPTDDSQPFGITVGPGNNIWFTEFAGNKVSRITPDGSFVEFPLTTAASGPRDLVMGRDGNLWVTLFNVNKIAKVAIDGTVTEYAIPKLGMDSSQVRSIINGPDGTPLWFTLTHDNRIGQITPSGNLITFKTVTTASSQPFGLTLWPVNNIWFTEFSAAANAVAKLVPADVLTISDNATLLNAAKNQVYSFTFTANDGTAPYTWTLASGSELPSGITLSEAGTLSGTPTQLETKSFVITLTDAENIQISKTFSLSVINADLPDLSVVLKSVKRKDGVLTAQAQPRNIGSQPSGAYSIKFYLSRDSVLDSSDKLISSQTAASLNAVTTGKAIKLKYSKKIASKLKQLIVCTDCDGSITEQDDSNNNDIKKLPK